MSSITPATNTPPAAAPQPAAPAPAPARNDHDADDASGAIKPALEKGVGEALDKTA
ncbi:MAG: hypothetical protein ACXWKM_04880 [Phenylobacterium sp.]